MMSTYCSKHVEAFNKLIINKILCIKLVNYQDYTEMHGQQNIKICVIIIIIIIIIIIVIIIIIIINRTSYVYLKKLLLLRLR